MTWHVVLIVAPLAVAGWLTAEERPFTGIDALVSGGMAAIGITGTIWLLTRLRRGAFSRRDHTGPVYTAEAEIGVDDEERRRAIERLRGSGRYLTKRETEAFAPVSLLCV
jgi:hypothetical protein